MEEYFDFEAAKKFALNKLKNELSDSLSYHCVEHTLDVVAATRLFGELEGLTNRDIRVLETAALFHDMGFVETYLNHEAISIQIAREALPAFGYSQDDIEVIANLIKATELPQNPQNLLEEILADSDLNYLGRNDMLTIGQRLRSEWEKNGHETTLKEWQALELKFLKQHRYFTRSAIKLREDQKQENIQTLEKLLGVEN